ncbi:MAG TPA: serine hydroxymethyltransferase [Thermomicrobiales bacterium]|nr:serine hydroxymethyltransferase [Thermomicrobiales bacterium]
MVAMSTSSLADTEIAAAIRREELRQRDGIELIASENFVSRDVMAAVGTVLTNKYAEGTVGKRYYGGCEFVDEVETLAIDRAKQLFGVEHVNVQPHSGANANLGAYMAIAEPGSRLLGLSLAEGGHLTHGHPVNFSGRLFEAHFYTLDPNTGLIDYDGLERIAKEVRPSIIVAGASAYSRVIDYVRIRQIADEVGAKVVADIAHPAGLIAAGLIPSPVGYAHIVTTTTHKTLRGPRGGMIMTTEDLGKAVDKSVFPGMQGGPLMHVIAGKAVAFRESLDPSFKDYAANVIANAQTMSDELIRRGMAIVSGGTDTHLMLVDITTSGMSGSKAEKLLDTVGITANKNAIPNDPRPPMQTSGIRLGSPAVTTRGYGQQEMRQVANMIVDVLSSPEDVALHNRVRDEVAQLSVRFPHPGVDA